MDVLTGEVCQSIIEKLLNTNMFQIISCDYGPLADVSGYMAIPNKLVINVREAHKEKLTTVSFFVKEVPQNNNFHAELVKKSGLFQREVHVYENILPKLATYIDGRVFPRVYFAINNHILVLEDLACQNYKTRDFESYDILHSKMTLKALAKLHAASIAYEEKNSTRLSSCFKGELTELLFPTDPEEKVFKFLQSAFDTLKGVLEVHFPQVPTKTVNKLNDLFRSVPHHLKKQKSTRNVVRHGDMWSNNVMFKYDEQGNPEDVRFVDFQLTRYDGPAYDVIMNLFVTTDKEFREIHLESLLQYYYDQFTKGLAFNGVRVKDIMSWNDFRKSVDEELPTTLAVAFTYVHFVLLPKERVEKILKNTELYMAHFETDRRAIVLDVMKSNDKYKKRVLDSVTELLAYVAK